MGTSSELIDPFNVVGRGSVDVGGETLTRSGCRLGRRRRLKVETYAKIT